MLKITIFNTLHEQAFVKNLIKIIQKKLIYRTAHF